MTSLKCLCVLWSISHSTEVCSELSARNKLTQKYSRAFIFELLSGLLLISQKEDIDGLSAIVNEASMVRKRERDASKQKSKFWEITYGFAWFGKEREMTKHFCIIERGWDKDQNYGNQACTKCQNKIVSKSFFSTAFLALISGWKAQISLESFRVLQCMLIFEPISLGLSTFVHFVMAHKYRVRRRINQTQRQ